MRPFPLTRTWSYISKAVLFPLSIRARSPAAQYRSAGSGYSYGIRKGQGRHGSIDALRVWCFQFLLFFGYYIIVAAFLIKSNGQFGPSSFSFSSAHRSLLFGFSFFFTGPAFLGSMLHIKSDSRSVTQSCFLAAGPSSIEGILIGRTLKDFVSTWDPRSSNRSGLPLATQGAPKPAQSLRPFFACLQHWPRKFSKVKNQKQKLPGSAVPRPARLAKTRSPQLGQIQSPDFISWQPQGRPFQANTRSQWAKGHCHGRNWFPLPKVWGIPAVFGNSERSKGEGHSSRTKDVGFGFVLLRPSLSRASWLYVCAIRSSRGMSLLVLSRDFRNGPENNFLQGPEQAVLGICVPEGTAAKETQTPSFSNTGQMIQTCSCYMDSVDCHG